MNIASASLGMHPQAYNRIFLDDGRHMDLVAGYPPIIEEIAAIFPIAKTLHGVLFAYGTTLYNPHKSEIPVWVLAHERRHTDEQAVTGLDSWWQRYLVDKQFRFEQELVAHQDEYQQMRKVVRRSEHRAANVRFIATRLAGPLYGEIVSYGEALKLIRAR